MLFTGIGPAVWGALQARAAGAGIAITSDVGQTSAKGVRVEWIYAPAQQILAVVISRSFFDPSQATLEADFTAIVIAAKGGQ